GLFQWIALGALAGITILASHLYVWFPVYDQRMHWQDAFLIVLLASPLVSGLTDLFRDIFPSPGDPIPPLHVLGQLMVIPLGAFVFLCLRGADRVDYRFAIRGRDLA